jgi:hypothetical protein
MRNLKAAEVREVESTSLDEQIDWAVQMTAACNEVLDWIESILPGGDARLLAASMLKKEKHALWFEHPSDLAKGFQRIGNGAKRPRTDDRIESSFEKRE